MATYRIYLVDDDRFLLDMYAVKFRAQGHDVTAFSSGKEVIEALKTKPAPDAMLLDIVMPEMDGFDILEVIRKEGIAPTTKVIILSNQGQQSDIDRAKELKVAGYIIKASAIPSEVYTETVSIIEKP